VPCEIISLGNGFPGICITCKDVLPIFTIEQCLTVLFRELGNIGRGNKVHTNGCVSVAWPCWSEFHSCAILDATLISDVRVL
jgi:hypothetical protein